MLLVPLENSKTKWAVNGLKKKMVKKILHSKYRLNHQEHRNEEKNKGKKVNGQDVPDIAKQTCINNLSYGATTAKSGQKSKD